MLFRANQEAADHHDANDSRWEDHPASTVKRPSQQQTHPRSSLGGLARPEPSSSEPDRVGGLQPLDGAPVRPPNGKFSALKRKLFPLMQRRAPLRVPAMLPLSPINTNPIANPTAMTPSPDLAQQSQQADSERDGNGSDGAVVGYKADDNDRGEDGAGHLGNNDVHEDLPTDCWLSNAIEKMGRALNRGEPAESARPNYDSDEDDRDLELAVEALDYESSNAEEMLTEVCTLTRFVIGRS